MRARNDEDSLSLVSGIAAGACRESSSTIRDGVWLMMSGRSNLFMKIVTREWPIVQSWSCSQFFDVRRVGNV